MRNEKKISEEEKIRLAKNAYMRSWREKNRDKVKKYQEKKWLRYYDEKVAN